MEKALMQIIPLTRVQKLIGERMLESKRVNPSHYISVFIKTEYVNKFRRAYGKQHGIRVSTNDVFLAAMAKALADFPRIAGRVEGDNLVIPERIDVGLAVAGTGDSLVVPVIRGAGNKSLAEIAASSADLIARAREGRLMLDELNGASLTLSSLAMFGVTSFVAIPQQDCSAILSAGKPDTRLSLDENGEITGDKGMVFCLSASARIASAFYCAKWLGAFKKYVENGF
jgi:pyruvate/2-oxoglutarate dehydrogenase complex dihydrolipoamide acyltransferase (E2) component